MFGTKEYKIEERGKIQEYKMNECAKQRMKKTQECEHMNQVMDE